MRRLLLLLAMLAAAVPAHSQSIAPDTNGTIVGGQGTVNDYIVHGTAGTVCALPTGTTAFSCLSTGFLKFIVRGVNFNSGNTDTAVTINLPPGITRWRISSMHITNASASISTATAGVFTGAGATGQTIAANQAITVTQSAADTNNNAQQLTATNQNTEAYSDTTIYFRVGTAQGSAATADVAIIIIPL